ncbi:hypothetical protein VCR9J2_100007 [Vibrio crassostreae]|nr:hypothetical protein VCR9J2_100007 [Vibrio crassostreae]
MVVIIQVIPRWSGTLKQVIGTYSRGDNRYNKRFKTDSQRLAVLV